MDMTEQDRALLSTLTSDLIRADDSNEKVYIKDFQIRSYTEGSYIRRIYALEILELHPKYTK